MRKAVMMGVCGRQVMHLSRLEIKNAPTQDSPKVISHEGNVRLASLLSQNSIPKRQKLNDFVKISIIINQSFMKIIFLILIFLASTLSVSATTTHTYQTGKK